MSSTLAINLSVTHQPSVGVAVAYNPQAIAATLTGDRHQKGRGFTNATGGTDAALPFGTVPTAGAAELFLKNLSLTDSIEVSYGTGGGFTAGKIDTIPPGRLMIIRASGQVYLKCAAATQPFEALLLEA